MGRVAELGSLGRFTHATMKSPRTFKSIPAIRKLADDALKEHADHPDKTVELLRDAVWSLCGFIELQQAQIRKLEERERQ